MALPTPERGLIISYSYLWQSEHEQGREEGIKDRPCAIILAVEEKDGEQTVTVVPVPTRCPPTRQPPLKFRCRPNNALVLMMPAHG